MAIIKTSIALAAIFCWAVGSSFAIAWQSDGGVHLADRLLSEPSDQLVADVKRFGDPVRGAAAFFKPEMNCAKCHQAGATGRRLGPNLAEKREVTVKHLIESVLQPSAQIKQGFETVLVQHVDGRTLTGVLVKQTDRELIIDQIEQPEKPMRISRDDIDDWRKTKVSSMPTALVNQLGDRNEFLDLIRYLQEIAADGEARAAALQPSRALVATPLPEYESNIDHAGMIKQLDRDAFKRGEELFRLRCASCHGTLDQEGSMPTSMRFASGKFKRGSDPYSMYRTLTHGLGMMNAQRWMVPQQKYDVVHYIREKFVRPNNRSQYFNVTPGYLAKLPAGNSQGPKPVVSRPWTQMDYGPSLNNTIEVSRDGTNIAQKGIAIRLDTGPGGVESGSHWILYEHDTMRVAAAWSGKFIDYNGIHFNGVHSHHPQVSGSVLFKNPTGPGVGQPGTSSFQDNRVAGRDGRRYGPLDRNWAHFKGLYRYGTQTILKYTVGQAEVLESPRLDYVDQQPVFVRTLNISQRNEDIVLQVAHLPNMSFRVADGNEATVLVGIDLKNKTQPNKSMLFDGQTYWQSNKSVDMARDFTIVADIKTTQDGTIFCQVQQEENSWQPNGQTFFIQDGRLHFDIGWVGVVEGEQEIADGKWHRVAVVYDADDEEIQFWVDGKPDGEAEELAAEQPLESPINRIGFTQSDFPDQPYFRGQIRNVMFFQKSANPNELVDRDDVQPIGVWLRAKESTHAPMGDVVFEKRTAGLPVSDANGLVAQIVPAGVAKWSWDDGENLRLRIPRGDQPLKIEILMIAEHSQPSEKLAARLADRQNVVDLKPLLNGGPRNWPQRLETAWQTGDPKAAYAVDVLPRPVENPWSDRLRLTGIDFLPGGKDAILCTWDGSIWKVSGFGGSEKKATWQRIAAGLFQPLGVKIVNGKIFVTCRDQLVGLHDLNGDGEIDWYENFNSDHQVTEHFHEFAMGLQTDDAGNFYYAKSARHALPALVPHHGTLLKVSADGSKTEIVATGFRAANGVCLNPDGSFVVTDQEGHWNPKNRINWVKPGGFYGNMYGYHDVTDSSDDAMEQPLCWITNSFDRSPAELLWVDSKKWGPLSGALLNFSYGFGKVYIVPHEQVNGQMQGGMCEIPIGQFPTGVMRGRFHPDDGQLYCCGMFAWSGTQQQPGGLYRVRYTERPANLPIGLSAYEHEIKITMSDDLDPASVADPKNYIVQTWSLKRTKSYGSDHYDEKRLKVTAAELDSDGKTIKLSIPEIEPTWCMEIVGAVKSKLGTPVRFKIHNTIHQLGSADQ